MGYIKNILFENFRNFEKSKFEFYPSCNVILGKNGSGKTNILEGLSLLEKGRGFKKDKVSNFINFNNDKLRFNIQSLFQDNGLNLNIKIFNSEKNLKKISVNNSFDTETINHFESLFSIIYFLPEMERLFLVSPSLRRNFLDRLIFNQEKNYNIVVNTYKKLLSDRQLLLKDINYDESWIEKIELNICEFGSIIYKKRIEHIENINKILKKLSINKNIYNNFQLKIKDKFLEKNHTIINDKELYLVTLKNNRKLDFFSGGCTIGPHRSDFTGFDMRNGFKLSQLSTGQQKTVILLIIISQCKFLINSLKLNPIIILDEVCSHLDKVNRDLLLYLIEDLNVQVFMTGTEENFFTFLSTKANYCNIN